MEFLYGYTEDNLKLQSIHWETDNKDICVVCIHGQTGNIIENYFANIWGNMLQRNNIAFIYGHNRGYNHINDIKLKSGSYRRIGAAFEIFEESIYDVELWVNKAKELGYKRIILLGHSLGCNKVIYYISEKGNLVDGVILASPPDMVGLTKIEEVNYEEIVEEAKNNIKNGQGKKLLKNLLGEWCYASSENFMNFYTEGNTIDNLPIERNPDKFDQLEKIKVPIFAFSGSRESETYLKVNLLISKARGSRDVSTKIMKDAGHTYKDVEEKVGKEILNWIIERFDV